MAVAAVGDLIYVVGSFGGGPEIEINDPESDSWSKGAAIPQSVHHAAAVELDRKLYVVGGFSGGWSLVNSVYADDPNLDRCEARAPLPTARGGLAPYLFVVQPSRLLKSLSRLEPKACTRLACIVSASVRVACIPFRSDEAGG